MSVESGHAGTRGSERRFGIAIVGFEHPHVIARIEAALADESVCVVAAHDPDEKLGRHWSAHYGLDYTHDLAGLLSNHEVDLVIVDAWDGLNPGFAKTAIEARKPFILEKPGARNLQEMEALALKADAGGVFNQMGYFARYSPAYVQAKAIIDSGILGHLSLTHIEGSTPVGGSNEIWQSRPDNRGGMLFTIGCHLMDMAVGLLGIPEVVAGHVVDLPPGPEVTAHHFKKDSYTVAGETKQIRFGDCRYEDVATALLDFNGISGTFAITGWDARPWVESFRQTFVGTNGFMSLRLEPAEVHLRLREASGPWPSGSTTLSFADTADWGPGLGSSLPYWSELQDVKQRLQRGETESPNPVATGLRVMRAIDDIYLTSDRRHAARKTPNVG